jgi:hypothetical protein
MGGVLKQLNFCAKLRCVVWFTLHSFTPGNDPPVPNTQQVGWVKTRSGCDGEQPTLDFLPVARIMSAVNSDDDDDDDSIQFIFIYVQTYLFIYVLIQQPEGQF